jgi:SAM-dependent methyltransferase
VTQLSSDRSAHRAWLTGLTGELVRGLVVDLGCGRGDDLRLLAAQHRGAGVRFVGVDSSAKAVAAAAGALAADSRVSLSCAALDGRLPFDDASVDVAYSHNLLECLPDPSAFACEVARVLRPGGRVVAGHWDWDSQLFDGADKALVRRLVHTFADWQQAWMAHADGWMGRRLWGVFQGAGLVDGAVHARVLTNTAYVPGCVGYENAQAFGALARRGLVPADEYERFLAEQVALAAAGRYFYSITGFAYSGQRAIA